MKKLLSFLLTAVLLYALCVPAFAMQIFVKNAHRQAHHSGGRIDRHN